MHYVDHGKTTLVDCLLRQSGTLDARAAVSERIMDNKVLERERGITILSKTPPSGGSKTAKPSASISWTHRDMRISAAMSNVCCDGGLGAAPSRSGGWADAADALRHAYGLRGGTQAYRRDQQDRPAARPDWVLN